MACFFFVGSCYQNEITRTQKYLLFIFMYIYLSFYYFKTQRVQKVIVIFDNARSILICEK